jgi:catechol 2,3-dioxygenase-like lactoylglutathione lyase family enzyme
MDHQKNLTEIDHLVVMVADLEQSMHWYTTSFNCEVLYTTPTLAVLQFGNIKLVLSLPSEQRPHVAYKKETASEFGEIIEQGDLCHSTFVADPTGNLVELVTKSIDEVLP